MTTRRAIITGASSGIGLAIARRLADGGVRVALTGRDPDRLAEAATTTGAVAHETVDVGDRHRLRVALDRLREALGGVDVVIANAGGTGTVPTDGDPDEVARVWHDVIAANLTGAFHTVLATAEHLPRPGGRVITLSSIAAAAPTGKGVLAYAAAKAGVDGLTRALAAELAPQGITVNAVAPGYVADTRFFGAGGEQERRERFAGIIPSGRVGRPEDVAALVCFLCSPDAGHINGQVLHVNGGQHLAG